jgi:hypothetical protein
MMMIYLARKKTRGEIADSRHCEEQRDEAIHSSVAAQWIASLTLAMTVLGCLKFVSSPSLPGLTRQSIILRKSLSKLDGCPDQVRA